MCLGGRGLEISHQLILKGLFRAQEIGLNVLKVLVSRLGSLEESAIGLRLRLYH